MKDEISFADWKVKLFRRDLDENLAEFREFFADNVEIWGEDNSDLPR